MGRGARVAQISGCWAAAADRTACMIGCGWRLRCMHMRCGPSALTHGGVRVPHAHDQAALALRARGWEPQRLREASPPANGIRGGGQCSPFCVSCKKDQCLN